MEKNAKWYRDNKDKVKAYCKENKEKISAKNRQYYQKHKEENTVRCRVYKAENLEKIKDTRRLYSKNNKEKITAEKKAWDAKNKEHVIAYRKEYALNNKELAVKLARSWQLANPAKAQAIRAKYRASKLQRTPIYADKAKIERYYALSHLMSILSGEKYHVDHIIPLQGKSVSGFHHEDNLQVIPQKENFSKHNNYIIELKPFEFQKVIRGK